MHWREIAWNGVRCEIPDYWDVAEIGPRYLMFADKSEPVLEIKWDRIKGRFSHRSQLRRLAVQHKKKFGKTVKKVTLPSEWKTLLNDFSSVAFSWHGTAIRGLGAILYCPACKTATLIQFFQVAPKHPDTVAHHILGSFQDHPQDNQGIWALYDIRALIPVEFNLIKYRFDAGYYELVFSNKKLKITLGRWGPASALLRNRDLEEFATMMSRHPSREPLPAVRTDPDAVEWVVSRPATWLARMRNIGWHKVNSGCHRFWHLKEKNRIFGVKIEGKKMVDAVFFDRICDDYGSI
jgi:hypothetical protein